MQYSTAPRLRERIRNILLMVLLAACIALAIFGGKAMSFQAETNTTFIHRLQTECNNAVILTGTLSRTAGANSAATLGRIRSHIYAMDTINQLHVGLNGAYLLDNETFSNMYTLLDGYSDKLTTGTQTGELQSSLTAALTELSNTVNGLK